MSTLTLRPNGIGDETNLSAYPGSGESNYEDVDEATSDDDTTYVYLTNAGFLGDLYATEDPPVGISGTINSVTVYANARAAYDPPSQASLRIRQKNGATLNESEDITVTGTYTLYSKTWATNSSGDPWTWDDITNLQIGVALQYSYYDIILDYYYDTRATQVYAVVDYESSRITHNTRQTMNEQPSVFFQTITQ